MKYKLHHHTGFALTSPVHARGFTECGTSGYTVGGFIPQPYADPSSWQCLGEFFLPGPKLEKAGLPLSRDFKSKVMSHMIGSVHHPTWRKRFRVLDSQLKIWFPMQKCTGLGGSWGSPALGLPTGDSSGRLTACWSPFRSPRTSHSWRTSW